MKNLVLFFTITIGLATCTKDVKVKNAIHNLKLSQKELLADGQSTVNISVELSNKSSADRRNIVFSTSGGVFKSSGNNKFTSKAEFENGILVAKAILTVSTQPGTLKIAAQPEFDSQVMEFILTDSAITKSSMPFSLKLEPSQFGIASNFLTEVQITGFLKNSTGNFVSKGYVVQFEDLNPSLGIANGRFRNIQNITADSSKVTAIYGANVYRIGTTIKIRATVFDEDGFPTSVKDSILLNINQ